MTTPATKPRRQRPTSDQTPSGGVRQKIAAFFNTPRLNYRAILVITGALTALGLVMVLSSSMATSWSAESSVWAVFLKQVGFAVVGLFFAWLALRMKAKTIRKIAPWLLFVALALQVALLIPGVGVGEEIGSHSWIRVGSVGIQPSELAKVALAVWGSMVISDRVRQTQSFLKGLGSFLLVGGTMMFLVLLQMDLGMMLTVGIVLFALTYFAGISRKLLALIFAGVGIAAVVSILTESYRNDRISTWREALLLSFNENTTQGASYQSYQGLLSLADGSFSGAGLGQSRAKWFYLPEAKNDFIFAIIGEELGWVGAVAVIVAFGALAYFGIRTALAQADPFLSYLSATLTLGVVVQAFYNIAYVLGLAPMTGIQLPLISAGGTSMVITLASLGLLANCARHEPTTISSMQHEGRSFFDRILMLPEPIPYRQGEERREERRNSTRRYGAPVTDRHSTPGSAGHDILRQRQRDRFARARIHRADRMNDYDGERSSSRREPLPPRRGIRRDAADQPRRGGKQVDRNRPRRR